MARFVLLPLEWCQIESIKKLCPTPTWLLPVRLQLRVQFRLRLAAAAAAAAATTLQQTSEKFGVSQRDGHSSAVFPRLTESDESTAGQVHKSLDLTQKLRVSMYKRTMQSERGVKEDREKCAGGVLGFVLVLAVGLMLGLGPESL